MHVVVELASTVGAVVAEPSIFDRFDVLVKGSDDPARLANAVEALGIGRLIDDDVFVRQEWLRSNADDGSADWTAGFAAMVKVAQRHGWLSADGLSIKAHVVLAPEPGAAKPATAAPGVPGSATSRTAADEPPTPTDSTGTIPVE